MIGGLLPTNFRVETTEEDKENDTDAMCSNTEEYKTAGIGNTQADTIQLIKDRKHMRNCRQKTKKVPYFKLTFT